MFAKNWLMRRRFGEVLAVITGSTTAVVSLGLAWASVGCGIFTPVGIFFIFASLVNLVANTIFYQRDTLRIGRWMDPRRAETVWPHIFAKNSKASRFKKLRCYVAAFFGFAELEAQLRIQHLSQTLCPEQLTRGDYVRLYEALVAHFRDGCLPEDPDFVRLYQAVLDCGDGVDPGHVQCQLVDYALGIDDYQFLMAAVILDAKMPDDYLGKAIFDGAYLVHRQDAVKERPVEYYFLPEAFDGDQLICRIWLRKYLKTLQKDDLSSPARKALLALLVPKTKEAKKKDLLSWPLFSRKAVTFVFLALAAMLSVGMSLILMRGLEGFFLKLGVAASVFTPIGGVLVGIAFFCILFQLYVTFNEFWVDAYVHNAGSFSDRLRRLGYQFKAWLTADVLVWDKNQPELIRNTGYRRWHIAKRFITGTLFLGIIAMAIIASIGLYKSFTLSLKTLFRGEHALVLLSPGVYMGIMLTLKVAFASRVKMAVILMGRCFWKAISGLAWTGRYFSIHCRYVFTSDPTVKAALKPEIDAYADSASTIRMNIQLFFVVLFNSVINLFWVDSHDFPLPLMLTAAGLQSQMLIGGNAMGSFGVPRLKPTRHYFEALMKADDQPEVVLTIKLSRLMAKPSHSTLWESANLLAVMYFKNQYIQSESIKTGWHNKNLLAPTTADELNQFVFDKTGILRNIGQPSYSDFDLVVKALYTEMAYNALPKLRLPFTWDWMRRLWAMGLTKWLSKGVGAGGALWFGYVIVGHMGWLPALTPVAAVAVPAVVLTLSIGLASFVVYDYVKSHTTQAGQLKPLPSFIEQSKLMSFALKTMGSAGIAWAMVAGAASCGASVPFLGLGLALSAFTFGAFLWCFEKELPNLHHLWFEVLGTGAAVWFMGRATFVMLQAAAGITLAASFHYVVVGIAATLMARALYQFVRSKFVDQPAHGADTGKLIQVPMPDEPEPTAHDLKVEVLNALWAPGFFTRARLQIEAQDAVATTAYRVD